MNVRVKSAALVGVEAREVDVEVRVSAGRSQVTFVGLPPTAAREAAVRVKSALARGGYDLSTLQFVASVVSGDPRGGCAALDLPAAVGVLAAAGVVPPAALDGVVLLGELGLDGSIRRVAGAFPIARRALAIGAREMILPSECAPEAALVYDDGFKVRGAATLPDVVAHLRGEDWLPLAAVTPQAPPPYVVDLAEVRGLEVARRALEVAAAGGHNLLFFGPPGSGKSLLARCLPTILPPLDEAEALETTCVYSAAGKLGGASLLATRPFRAPHHDVSVAGLVGGGPVPRPGEISLAHHGVLFLDELPEFPRAALEALRQPIEERKVTIARRDSTLTFPAAFAVVAAMNPCPCGYRGSSLRACTCSEGAVGRYLGRVAPHLGHVDIHVEVPHVDYRTLRSSRAGEASADVRARVVAAREVQRRRFAGATARTNAEMSAGQIREHVRLAPAADRHLEACVTRFGFSGKVVHQILRVARTVADLADRDTVAPADVAEAIAIRALDRETMVSAAAS